MLGSGLTEMWYLLKMWYLPDRVPSGGTVIVKREVESQVDENCEAHWTDISIIDYLWP